MVVVFGGTGFVGKNLQKVKPNWKYVGSKECDLSNLDAVREYLKNIEPYGIINLAANVGGITHNVGNNLDMMIDNFAITTNVIKVAMEIGIPRVVTALSTCAWPEKSMRIGHTYPMKSDDIFSGKPPNSNIGYALAKRAAFVATQHARESGFDYVTFAPSNVYGPHDNFGESSHFIASLIKKSVESKNGKLELLGLPSTLRQQLYVGDLVHAIVGTYDVYNGDLPLIISPDDNTSVDKAVELVLKNLELNLKVSYSGTHIGVHRKDISNGTFRKLFPMFEFTTIEDGLSKTIEWYRNETNK